MKGIHGGDIYRNDVKMDFSVNVNPLGMPETVKVALYEAVEKCNKYPDISSENLKVAISEMLKISKDNLLLGNGASELFMAIIHGLKPKRIVIPVPSFYGYEYAVNSEDGEIIFYETKEENNFSLKEDFLLLLKEDVDVVFLANPNNPTGNLISCENLRKFLYYCQNKGIYVVLDECFIEFCNKEYSMLHETEKLSNLIIVRAFTKIFSIPGVRLGYLVCNNQLLINKISRQLPEWNISSFAQAAGLECTKQTEFIRKTLAYVEIEREFLEARLKQMGFKVFSSQASFIMIYCELPLYDRLLEKGILIRDCESFRGLKKGFYRIAVKSRKENEALLKAIGEIKWRE